MGSKFSKFLLCCMLCVGLLGACGGQAAEDPALTQPTTEATQPQGLPENSGEKVEPPADPVPQQTQPVTDATGAAEPDFETKPTEGTKPTEPPKQTPPPEVSEPSQPTTEAEPTEPETTPTETVPTEPPELDEDELPPVPLF